MQITLICFTSDSMVFTVGSEQTMFGRIWLNDKMNISRSTYWMTAPHLHLQMCHQTVRREAHTHGDSVAIRLSVLMLMLMLVSSVIQTHDPLFMMPTLPPLYMQINHCLVTVLLINAPYRLQIVHLYAAIIEAFFYTYRFVCWIRGNT